MNAVTTVLNERARDVGYGVRENWVLNHSSATHHLTLS